MRDSIRALLGIKDDLPRDFSSWEVAGKTPSDRTHFSENHGNVAAYGVFSHRHGAEIEQELHARVTFVPHLVPLDRGILETIYATLTRRATSRNCLATTQSLITLKMKP